MQQIPAGSFTVDGGMAGLQAAVPQQAPAQGGQGQVKLESQKFAVPLVDKVFNPWASMAVRQAGQNWVPGKKGGGNLLTFLQGLPEKTVEAIRKRAQSVTLLALAVALEFASKYPTLDLILGAGVTQDGAGKILTWAATGVKSSEGGKWAQQRTVPIASKFLGEGVASAAWSLTETVATGNTINTVPSGPATIEGIINFSFTWNFAKNGDVDKAKLPFTIKTGPAGGTATWGDLQPDFSGGPGPRP